MRAGLLPSLTALGAVASALPATDGASGKNNSNTAASTDVTIEFPQLYPESADFHKANGKTYMSILYNAAVAVYDAAQNRVVDTIKFDRTDVVEFHASGVEVDQKTNQLSVTINSGIAFDTAGANVTGDNFLYKVDLSGDKPKTLWNANLTAVTNGAYGGCQDMVHDTCGNTFVVCTYPGAIIKVNADGSKAIPWYLSNYTRPGTSPILPGLTGIVASGDLLIANDAQAKQLVSFNKRDSLGKRVVIPVTGLTGESGDDGVYLPEKYAGKVLLTQLSTEGTNVFVSKDGWKSAEFVKKIPSKYTPQNVGGFAVATVQVQDKIYGVIEYFLDDKNGGIAGNRTKFELEDLTTQIDEAVEGKI
ncbi:TRI14-like protein [Metarhizium guizhouense ARSEF 977]|uniref:TRI14-like protein n=1 Tax=Metarhizium guizhouense (strain ARSEF 977) TaxID=1276136 RepID=A0A0B4GYM3_METGA|nr:TRI14-like protein [Metarhizium guizhouense ARSEF 977]